MSYQQEPGRPLISGAFVVVSTRTFLLMLAVTPVGLLLPRGFAVLMTAALVGSLILDWRRTCGAFPTRR